eukprot:COSAG06_NODE_8470_length_2162_cov_2.159476_2_plen_393_part_01
MSSPVASWSVDDVCQFVCSRLSAYTIGDARADSSHDPHAVAQRFREEHIGGSALLLYARDSQDLVLDLGLSTATATVLWAAIRELQMATPASRTGRELAALSEGVPPAPIARSTDVALGNPGALLGTLELMFPSAAAGQGSLVLELEQTAAGPSTEPMDADGPRNLDSIHELRGLKLSVLKKRARAAGVTERLLEQADDSDAPKDSVVRLLLDASTRSASAMAGGQAELRQELSALKMSALKKRARTQGVDETMLEEAEDADAPREAIVDLIVAAAARSADQADSARERLRDDLAGLKLSALKKHALSIGVNEMEFEEAEDGATPRQSIVELVLAKATNRSASSRGRDNAAACVIGNTPGPEPEPEPEPDSTLVADSDAVVALRLQLQAKKIM